MRSRRKDAEPLLIQQFLEAGMVPQGIEKGVQAQNPGGEAEKGRIGQSLPGLFQGQVLKRVAQSMDDTPLYPLRLALGAGHLAVDLVEQRGEGGCGRDAA